MQMSARTTDIKDKGGLLSIIKRPKFSTSGKRWGNEKELQIRNQQECEQKKELLMGENSSMDNRERNIIYW